MSIQPFSSKLPKSLDNACTNLTNKPTQVLGSIIADWIYIHFGDVIHDAEKKRILHKADLESFQNSLLSKAEEIPDDKCCNPDSRIVAKALDEVIYIDSTSSAREIFTNLILSSMHEDLSIYNHVALIEIAKQLSSIDAQVFKILTYKQNIPICKVFQLKDDSFFDMYDAFDELNDSPKSNRDDDIPVVSFPNLSGIDISMHYTLLNEFKYPHFQLEQSLDNLSRLGLILIDYTITLPEVSYEAFGTNPDIADYLAKSTKDKPYILVPGVCSLTKLGKTFASVCIG